MPPTYLGKFLVIQAPIVQTSKVTQPACAIWAQDPGAVSEVVTRFFMHNHQFQGEAYRLFIAAMTSCKESRLSCKQGREIFHHSANQKYFLWQIKAMEKSLLER